MAGGVGGKKAEEVGGKRWEMIGGGHLSSTRGGCWARPAARLAVGPCAVLGPTRVKRVLGRGLCAGAGRRALGRALAGERCVVGGAVLCRRPNLGQKAMFLFPAPT